MGKRKLEEINAGSMADIAFLLLIFFLVTTTMDTDEGIVRNLPQKVPNDMVLEVHDRDVFEVLANANDQLLVENNYIDIKELKDLTKEFMTNPEKRADLPSIMMVNESVAQYKIDSIKAALADPKVDIKLIKVLEADLDDWQDKMEAAKKAGTFYTVSKFAMISLRNDNNTSYKLYVQVQNELQSAVDELRNEWSQKIYKENYTDWSPNNPSDAEKMKIIRAIVPQRIAEQQPKDIPAY
jgi:biopolymer transport protein ExbD